MLLLSAVVASQIAIAPPQPINADELEQEVKTTLNASLAEGQRQLREQLRVEVLDAAEMMAIKIALPFAAPSIAVAE